MPKLFVIVAVYQSLLETTCLLHLPQYMDHARKSRLSYVLLECINTIYKYSHAWVIE